VRLPERVCTCDSHQFKIRTDIVVIHESIQKIAADDQLYNDSGDFKHKGYVIFCLLNSRKAIAALATLQHHPPVEEARGAKKN